MHPLVRLASQRSLKGNHISGTIPLDLGLLTNLGSLCAVTPPQPPLLRSTATVLLPHTSLTSRHTTIC
jgi:hypothetical protein